MDTFQIIFKKGISKFNLKDYKGAIEEFSMSLDMDPLYSYSYYNRGAAKSNLEDYQGAISDFDKTIEINPKFAPAYYNRGILKATYKDYNDAIKDYSKALEINPEYLDAYNRRGLAKKNLKDFQGAIEDYNKVIEINPESVFAYNNRGLAKKNLNDFNGAIEDFSKSLTINPDIAEIHFFRGKAKYNLKSFQDAIEDFNKVIEINPKAAYAIYYKGLSKANVNDFQGAIEAYSKALEILPEFAFAYRNRGNAKYNIKDYEGAIADYEKAIEITPQFALILKGQSIKNCNLLLAKQNYQESNYSKAKEYFDLYLSIISENIDFKNLSCLISISVDYIDSIISLSSLNISDSNPIFKRFDAVKQIIKTSLENDQILTKHEDNIRKLFIYKQSYKVHWGEYSGTEIIEIIKINPKYILSCIINLEHFAIDNHLFLLDNVRRDSTFLTALEINLCKHRIVKKWPIETKDYEPEPFGARLYGYENWDQMIFYEVYDGNINAWNDD